MNSYAEIERAIKNAEGDGGGDDYAGVEELTGTDMVKILQRRVESLMNENIELNNRVVDMEGKVNAMYAHFMKSPERDKFDFPDHNKLRGKFVTEIDTLDHQMTPRRESSYVEVNSTASAPSTSDASEWRPSTEPRSSRRSAPRASSFGPTPGSPNPFSMYLSSSSKTEMFKSNSATAPQGYNNRGHVWGSALVSFLTAAMRYYITKKNSAMLMVDEMKMFSVYSKLVPVLYETFMTKQLPGVADPLTFRLSQAISRTDKNHIPSSDAESWIALEKTQEGREIMTIVRIVLAAAKAVPEAMVHPVSQIIPSLHKTPVMMYNEEPIFAIDSNVDVSPMPTSWESWCMILKNDALIKYVRYRVSGMTPIETVNRMTSEMKPSELAEKKNWNKLMSFNPAMLGSQTDQSG